jgi:hypothetical protein
MEDCLGDKGCKFTNYGITTWECTSCCSTQACNTDNKAAKLETILYLQILAIFIFKNK